MGYTEGAHDSPADTANRLLRIGSKYQATAPTVADGDNAFLLVDAAGRLKLAFTAAIFKMVDAVAIVAGTPAVVWTPAAGKKVRLLGWFLSSSAAAALEFQDSGAAGTVIAQTPLLAAAGVHSADRLGEGVILAAANNTLKLDVTVNATISGMVFGVEQ